MPHRADWRCQRQRDERHTHSRLSLLTSRLSRLRQNPERQLALTMPLGPCHLARERAAASDRCRCVKAPKRHCSAATANLLNPFRRGVIARLIACPHFGRRRVRIEECQQDLVTDARRTDKLQHASLTCFATPLGLLKAATSAQSKPVNRFQRPSIWSVENSESIVKFAARRR